MNKPHIICHMEMSLDGRIDCDMTENLPGGNEYYEILDSFHGDAMVSGKITAILHMADKGLFENNDSPINKLDVFKGNTHKPYEVVMDTKGTLLWDDYTDKNDLIIVTSEQASKDYLSYLKQLGISYISAGKNKIDLTKTVEILKEQFDVNTLLVVGGGHINASFLKEGLIDEISILLGAGIDGREKMASVFDGLEMDQKLTKLHLLEVKKMDELVYLRYKVI